MAYYTNPYTGQASVIGALQSTQDIIRGLSEGYIRSKEAEREAELRRLGIELQGAQLQAQQEIDLARIEAEKERRLRDLEREAEESRRMQEYREGLLGLQGKELELERERFEKVEIPTAKARTLETVFNTPMSPNQIAQQFYVPGCAAEKNFLEKFDPATLDTPYLILGKVAETLTTEGRKSPYTKALEAAETAKKRGQDLINSMLDPYIPPDSPEYEKTVEALSSINPYIKIDTDIYVEPSWTPGEPVPTSKEPIPISLEEARRIKKEDPERRIIYEYTASLDVPAISRDYKLDIDDTTLNKLARELSVLADIPIENARSFIVNNYTGTLNIYKQSYDEMTDDIYNQYLQYIRNQSSTTPSRTATPMSSWGFGPAFTEPYYSPGKAIFEETPRTAMPRYEESRISQKPQVPKGAVNLGTSKITGKTYYRLPDGTYWEE